MCFSQVISTKLTKLELEVKIALLAVSSARGRFDQFPP
jgi:hypothetical protein